MARISDVLACAAATPASACAIASFAASSATVASLIFSFSASSLRPFSAICASSAAASARLSSISAAWAIGVRKSGTQIAAVASAARARQSKRIARLSRLYTNNKEPQSKNKSVPQRGWYGLKAETLANPIAARQGGRL